MPLHNGFRHQRYTADTPRVPYEVVRPSAPVALDSDAYWERLAEGGQSLSRAGVSSIYLVHGTLTGTDMTGWIGELGRIVPSWAEVLRKQEKRIVDSVIGGWGNYDDDYESTLRDGINARLINPIEVKRYHWTSQNHHLGRADGAIRLIAELRDHQLSRARQQDDTRRIMLWGHSHAGNVFALVSNLLGGLPKQRRAFFRAARSFYRFPKSAKIDLPEWERTRAWMSAVKRNPLARCPLDFVTFGTPIRYGWDSAGYRRLLHVINHRVSEHLPDYRARFPMPIEQIRSAGDAFQQLFIAGTNFPPNLFSWRSWIADRRLAKLVQENRGRQRLWKNLQAGMRVPDEGETLLVDYASGDQDDARSLFGHAIYTNRRWLPFHLDAVLSRLYGKSEPRRNEADGVETDSSHHNG